MIVTKTNRLTGVTNSMSLAITEEQIESYKAGALIQDAFPQLTPDEREFMLTGFLPSEFEKRFPEKEDS